MTHTLISIAISLFLSDSTFNPKAFKDAGQTIEAYGHTLKQSYPTTYRSRGKHYASAKGAISIYPNWVMGVLFTDTGNVNITQNKAGKYILVNEATLPVKNPFVCHTPDDDKHDHDHSPAQTKAFSGTCRTVTNYFVADYATYLSRGSSVQATRDYVEGLFNVVHSLYLMSTIDVKIGRLDVFSTPDPFTGTTASTLLSQFSTYQRSIPHGQSLAHLVSTRSGGLGGVAYLNTLCNTNGLNSAFSNIQNSFQGIGIYSWTVNVVAHEMGHNLGSNHTHWCGWLHPDGQRRPIDLCAAVESFQGNRCYTGSTQRAGGTIMSYCHTNGSVRFDLGFGALPTAVMRNAIAASTCLQGYNMENFSLSGTFATCPGQPLQRTVTGISGHTVSWAPATPQVGTNTATVTKNGCSVQKQMTIRQNVTTSTPINQTFEASTSLPAGYVVANPNLNNTWIIHQGASVAPGNRSLRLNNYSTPIGGNTTGHPDSLFSPVFQSSTAMATRFVFNYAYRLLSNTFPDTLEVGIILNCQNNQYIRAWRKGGNDLNTTTRAMTNFVPLANEWLADSITLPTNTSVQIVIVGQSMYGNSFWLDNFNLRTGQAGGCPFTTLPPQPGAITGDGLVCLGSTRTYSIAPILSASTYNWTVPAGAVIVSGQGTTSITVSNMVAGNISVTATNCVGTGAARSLSISTVTPPAQPGNIIGLTNICPSGQSTYSVPSQAGVTFNWFVEPGWNILGGGTNTVNATWSALASQIEVSASNNCGESARRTLALNGIPAPVLSGITGDATFCPGQNKTYSTTSLPNTQYTWTLPSGWAPTTDNTASITVPTGTQSGTITVLARDNRCLGSPSNLVSLPVTVNCAQPCQLVDVSSPGNAITIWPEVGSRSPANEEVFRAIDNSITTKYLNFFGGGSGFTIDVGAATVVSALGLTSANDVPSRDPSTYELRGSNDGVNFAIISSGPAPTWTARRQRQQVEFPNATAYRYYRLIFPTVIGASCTNCSVMQIAEVELLGCQAPQAIRRGTFDLFGRPSKATAPGWYYIDGKLTLKP